MKSILNVREGRVCLCVSLFFLRTRALFLVTVAKAYFHANYGTSSICVRIRI